MKNWMALPARITAVYFPREPRIIPPLSCPESCAAKAAIPSGRVQMSARIRVKKSSWRPCMPFTTTPFPSLSGIKERASPTATAMRRMDMTLPERNGWMTLVGITEMIWS